MDVLKLMQQAQEVQGRMQQMHEALGARRVTGAAGGGLVRVDVDGKGMVKAVSLDPSVVKAEDVEMLEDLIVVAVAEAQKKAAELAAGEMEKLTGGMQLPFKLPF